MHGGKFNHNLAQTKAHTIKGDDGCALGYECLRLE